MVALEEQLELLEDAFVRQELYILDGYIATVWQDPEGLYVASCPTLHASTQARTRGDVVVRLREAMSVAIQGRQSTGVPVPPKDVDARCLG